MVMDIAEPKDAPVCSTPVNAKERRLVHRFMVHWVTLRRDNDLPSIDDLDITTLPAPWSQCFLVTRSWKNDGDEFDHLGGVFSGDQDVAGGNRLDTIRSESLLDYVTRPLERVIADQSPMMSSGSIATSNRRHVRFRSIILPFDGRTSGNLYLLGSANWREDALGSTADLEELACHIFQHGDWRPVNLPRG